jgi:5-methylcytosine-specific restriction protein A
VTDRNPFETVKRKPLTTLQRARMFAAHQGICCICSHKIDGGHEPWIDEHILPLSQGGTNDMQNRGPVHKHCARDKTSTDAEDLSTIRNGYATRVGAKVAKTPMPGGRNSPWKKTFANGWVRRDET